MILNERHYQERKRLTETLERLRVDGFRVFISSDEEYNYGLITDGAHMIGIENAPYFNGFVLTYDYVPKEKFGTGVGYLDPLVGKTNITREDIKGCISYGIGYTAKHGIRRYASLDEFMKRRESFYKELPAA